MRMLERVKEVGYNIDHTFRNVLPLIYTYIEEIQMNMTIYDLDNKSVTFFFFIFLGKIYYEISNKHLFIIKKLPTKIKTQNHCSLIHHNAIIYEKEKSKFFFFFFFKNKS